MESLGRGSVRGNCGTGAHSCCTVQGRHLAHVTAQATVASAHQRVQDLHCGQYRDVLVIARSCCIPQAMHTQYHNQVFKKSDAFIRASLWNMFPSAGSETAGGLLQVGHLGLQGRWGDAAQYAIKTGNRQPEEPFVVAHAQPNAGGIFGFATTRSDRITQGRQCVTPHFFVCRRGYPPRPPGSVPLAGPNPCLRGVLSVLRPVTGVR